MNIKSHFIVLVSLAYIHTAWGDDINLTKISEAHSHILNLQQKYGADAVLVISDVDGTLTSLSHPDDSPKAPPAVPRGTAVQMIQDIQQKGSPIVVSSAWDNFNGTTKRLTELNLSKTLEIPPDQKFRSRPDVIRVHGALIRVEYYEAGNAVSIKVLKQTGQQDPYYFNKALAPYLDPDIKENIESGKIKKVVFLDDSERNHDVFAADVKKYNLYPGASIDYIKLAPPSEDPAEGMHPHAEACSSTEASSPISNITEALDNDAKVAHAVNHLPHPHLKPSDATQDEIKIVSDRDTAMKQIQTAAPGTALYWKSASQPGALGMVQKSMDGKIVGPSLIKR